MSRLTEGLQAAFTSAFPIVSNNGYARMEYVSYQLSQPPFDVKECQQRGYTYHSALRAKVRLIIYDREAPTKVKEVKESEVYMGEIPLMTENGSFVINGTERVIVSQLHRSPGVFFEHDKGKTHSSGKLLFSARIIPYRGSWLDFEFDPKDILYFRVDRRRKMPVTILLKAIGLNNEQILANFFNFDHFTLSANGASMEFVPERLRGQLANFDVLDKNGVVVIQKDKRINAKHIRELEAAKTKNIVVPDDYLVGRVVARNIIDPDSGEILAYANDEITEELLATLRDAGIKQLETIYTNDLDSGAYISQTLRTDETADQMAARIAIYRMMRPGEPPTEDAVEALFQRLFYNEDSYDLSRVGRMKVNSRLGRAEMEGLMVLSNEDILDTIKLLVDLRNGKGEVDDIDHLGNRRVRCVGELAENQFRAGLSRVERAVKERLGQAETENLMPHDLINSKPISSAIREFFGSSQLSQFMDQTNPLSEITHKRRISALGPGGLTRERAGFEVRDVHPTHYGRVCPIETPEGPNIGLINSLALFARLNEHGFLETPYRKVANSKVSDEVMYLSAIEEAKYIIAQANATIDKNGKLADELVSARQAGETLMVSPERVDFIDVAPSQIVSAAASLVPFLEHDDANRALMGSNMQRQAVPLIRPQAPMVGTGVEKLVSRDSWECIYAKRSGIVEKADAKHIYIKGEDEDGIFIDYYPLQKNLRTNQNTSFSQKPVVKIGQFVEKDHIIADGPNMDQGELALGVNAMVAFMPWNGYNFEDAIVISERMIREDAFTSVHIYEKECEARELKHGVEEITRDIPNVREEDLAHLDESGIAKIGTNVKGGMILVGKVSPKGEVKPTPEERLLRAIFGEKSGHVVNKSLYCPPSMEGVIVDIKIFTKKGYDKDPRSLELEKEERDYLEREHYDRLLMIDKEEIFRITALLTKEPLGKDVSVNGTDYKKGDIINGEDLKDVNRFAMNNIVKSFTDEIQNQYNVMKNYFQKQKRIFRDEHEEKLAILENDDILPNGVVKYVKIYIATKRQLKVGDKMAGRHGNKGIVSNIVPEVDMPYMEDGRSVDVCLNPLGVPSRMNIGQVLEMHLGMAGRELGHQIQAEFDAKQADFLDNIRAKMIEISDVAGLMNGAEVLGKMSNDELLKYARDWAKGVKFATPIFEGVNEAEFAKLFAMAKMSSDGKTVLHDGRTGEKMRERVNVGYMYILKLHHLVDEKIHARSTGPYSLVTQQPVGGKALFGGQRFGEMEVWALEAYGASAVLKEMLTIKSDDVDGRVRAYKALTKGELVPESGIPETLFVLTKELQALALDVEIFDEVEDDE